MQIADVKNVDIVIIGAGFSGLYALHRLRDYNVVCFEAGEGVGGTWYWNRYPGARVDIQSVEYSYSFDKELEQEWSWPEYFSGQAELERYANHVADRHKLRDRIRLSTRVVSMRFDEGINRWQVQTEKGDTVKSKYVVAATGALSAPNSPPWPDRELFEGEIYHTAEWPRDGVDLSGKRVGQIGTGSTGLQVAPMLAEQVEHLYVFQRTPAFAMPSGNRPMDPAYERAWKANYQARRRQMLETYGVSMVMELPQFCAHECTHEEQMAILEEAWNSQSAFKMMIAFKDVMTDKAANELVSEFVRQKIRGIVNNPATAELLCPKTYPLGSKRLCIENGYFEMFNRKNVTLVDVRSDAIVGYTRTGLRTTGAHYDLDVIVNATGFDAITGAMSRIEILGLAGLSLAKKWADGPTVWLGTMIAGFPNLLMIHGPMTPGAQAQMLTSGEWQVDFVARIIDEMERDGLCRIDTTIEAERLWAEEVEMCAQHTLHRFTDSWYNGKNIEGKKGGFMIYIGGFPRFAQLCQAAVNDGYKGFIRSA